ncbi:MAG TPA: hypothetical protein VN937_06265 [Blastocatellia bacterium]|nr:hypothetical protein [Blastocatellia bacterium]
MKTTEQLKAENEAIRSMLAAGAGQRLLGIPNVLHVSVGLKERGGKIGDQLCVRVYVKEKKEREVVPADELIPAEVNGVATDVNVVGQFEFSDDNTKYRPIKGGIQISNRISVLNDAGTDIEISRGTLGCIAIDTTDEAPVILSNWHVLYGSAGRTGDKVYQPPPTSIPQSQLGDLPVRPTDDVDKIGVLRRQELSNSVDGAIAAIDVSSCCHCCGIHYSNEINGLSVAGRPPRNTIVGDQKAVSGMPVFKVGKSTGRTEGVVVDDNHPSFDIEKDGTTHTFTGQIAIQNIDNTKPFSTHGDSGSVIINLDNKIVGLLFASGKKVMVKGVVQPFVTIANHIDDVLSALKIRIPYSQDVKVISGNSLAAVPTVFEAPIPEPYRVLRERLQNNDVTAKLFAIGQRHSDEIIYLVNHCRPVTVAWRRLEGPAILATVMGAVRDGHYRLPEKIKGVAPYELLERMRVVLGERGSPALRETMNSSGVDLERMFWNCDNLNDLIARIASDPGLVGLLEGADK